MSDLSVGQQQWVEILKALYVGVDLLILDEPTAVLTPMESERLFSVLARMRAGGLSIILITHKLDEVKRVSDRVTVLASGEVVATVDTAAVTTADLARMMIGRELTTSRQRELREPGQVVLDVRDLVVAGREQHDAVRGVSFAVRQHEILSIVGVSGNGQRELFAALVGARRRRVGHIALLGVDVTRQSAHHRIDAASASVPEDRIAEGLVMDFRIDENLVLGLHRESAFSRWGFLRRGAIETFAGESIEHFGIATPSARQPTRVLSGGNLQKVILARELSREPRVPRGQPADAGARRRRRRVRAPAAARRADAGLGDRAALGRPRRGVRRWPTGSWSCSTVSSSAASTRPPPRSNRSGS